MVKLLFIVTSVVGIACLCACAPDSQTTVETTTPSLESSPVAEQTARCLQELYVDAVERLSSQSSHPVNDNAAYQRASEITTDNSLQNAYHILSEAIKHKEEWEEAEMPGNVYLVSGYGLGYTDQLSYGKWYYYSTPMLVEPYSSEAKKLNDIITAQGDFAPRTTDIFPDNGQIDVPIEDLPFIWTVYEFSNAESYTFIVSPNSDLHSPCVCVDLTDQFYLYSEVLDYETVYYWQVTGWKDGCFSGQGPIRVFCTQRSNAPKTLLDIEQAIKDADITRTKQLEKMRQAESAHEALHDCWDYYVLEMPWILMRGEETHDQWGMTDVIIASDAAEARQLGYQYWVKESEIDYDALERLLNETIDAQLYECLRGVDLELFGGIGLTHYSIARDLIPESTMKALEQIARKKALGWELKS